MKAILPSMVLGIGLWLIIIFIFVPSAILLALGILFSAFGVFLFNRIWKQSS